MIRATLELAAISAFLAALFAWAPIIGAAIH
jgi:hypothetical protein